MKYFAPLLLILIANSGCSSATDEQKPGLLPGHCINNEDCPAGTECNRKIGWCEDIYFPREKIKNY